MDEFFETVLSNTYTKQALHHRLALMREFARQYVYTATHGEQADELTTFLDERGESESTKRALHEWGDAFWSKVTTGRIEDTAEQLSKQAENVNEIVLYVPVALEEERLSSLGEWAREHIDPRVIFTIHITDQYAAGGCGFTLGDQYYDYSIARRISLNHDKVYQMIRSYGYEDRKADAAV